MNPDSLTVAPRPMSRSPDVIRAPHVITCAAIVIRPVANLDRDGAWVTSITGSVWAITRVTRSVRWISTIIIGASACTDSYRKEKEQENRPFWLGFRSIPDGDRLRFRVINKVHFHHIRLRRNFTRLNSRTSARNPARGQWILARDRANG